MSISALSSGVTSSCSALKPAIAYNHQQAIDSMNQKTGMNYSLQTEKSADGAQMVLNIFA